MKSILTIFISCIILLTSFISCNNSQESAGPYTLKMRLKPGDRFKQDMDMKMNMSINDFDTNMEMQEGANFEVMAGDTVNKTLKITYTHLFTQMDKNMPGQDGTDNLNKQINDRIKGKSVIVKLSPGNKITEVTGLNEMFPDSLAGPGNDDLKALFDKAELNKTFGMMFSLYPEKPVKKDESWNAVTNMGIAGINIIVNREYTLQSVKDGMATITYKGKLVNAGKMELSGQQFSMTLNGTLTGTMQINADDGYMRKGDFKMYMTGQVTMSEQKIPVVMKVEGNLEGK